MIAYIQLQKDIFTEESAFDQFAAALGQVIEVDEVLENDTDFRIAVELEEHDDLEVLTYCVRIVSESLVDQDIFVKPFLSYAIYEDDESTPVSIVTNNLLYAPVDCDCPEGYCASAAEDYIRKNAVPGGVAGTPLENKENPISWVTKDDPLNPIRVFLGLTGLP